MSRPNVLVLLITLYCLSTFLSTSGFATELIPHKASYTAKIKKGISINGAAVRELKKLDNGEWLYRFDVDSFVADIDESVHFSWVNNKVVPRKYKYKLSPFLAKNRTNKYVFDWSNKTIKGTYKKKKWLIEDIPDNSFDRLGYQLQMIMDIYANKPDMYYQIVRKKTLNQSHFQIIGDEIIDTKFGKLNSILVTKIRAKKKKRKTHMWFSKDYPVLLLKMTQKEKNGEEYEITLKSAEIMGKKISFRSKQADSASH